MAILTNKRPNLTENAKVLILSKLEEGYWIRRVAQYYNIAKSTVQMIKQTLLWCSKITETLYVDKLKLPIQDVSEIRVLTLTSERTR
jgi:hypothetical protein